MPTLLPSNSTTTERAIEGATARIEAVPVPIAALWNPQSCPAAFLPWLAHALSVDDWDATWSEATKRAVIAASIEVHRHKGTRWAIKRQLAAMGYGTAELVEFYGVDSYDGTYQHDGARNHMSADDWADYRVVMSRPITISEGRAVRAVLGNIAPVRCRLRLIDCRPAPNHYNGAIQHNQIYTHGVL